MKLKRICSALLAATLLFTLLPVTVLAAPTGSSVSVEIVGAAKGETTDLRDSQLLEAKVTNYTGTGSLYFKWTNEIPKNSKIYVFNEYNMTVADAQEILYGHSSERLENYRYAAVSSEWAKDDDVDGDGKHLGTLKVEVYDGEGKIGEATYDKGFKPGSLETDLETVPLGMFVGDTATARDLFGQMGVTHITCTNSSVSSMETVTGDQWTSGVISITLPASDSVWYIKGEKVGEAQLKVKVSKGADCAFHRGQTATATVGVHVFDKPNWESDYTAITISNLKQGYTYTIGNQTFTCTADGQTHTFTGLNSNTTYQLQVQEYCSEKNAYVSAYLSVSTKSLHRVGVYVAKNNIPNRIDDGVDTLTLTNGTETHTLTYSEGDHGYFGAAPAGDWKIMHGDKELGTVSVSKDIANARYIIYYSVTTDVNGTLSEKWLLAGEHVDAPLAPTDLPDGKLFAGWTADKAGDNRPKNSTYQPEDHYKLALDAPVKWTAVLVEPKSVAVKVTLDPEPEQGSGSNRDESENATLKGVTLNLWKVEGTGANINFSEAGKYTITGSEEGFSAERYTHTFTGLLPGNYQVTTSPKENYDATVTPTSDEAAKEQTISVTLKYNPQDFMLNFDVKLDSTAKDYVQAVECRITFYDDSVDGGFSYIEQHQNGGVSATFGENQTQTTVEYPVWQKANGATENSRYGVEVMAYRLADNTTVLAKDAPFEVKFNYNGIDNDAELTENGKAFKPESNKGLHWDNTANSQAGSLTVTVKAEPKTITFVTGAGGDMPFDVGDSKDYIIMPRLRAIEPEPSEGYVFLGWKTADGSPAAPEAGAVLTQDLTLVAQWAEPRTIEGEITVDHNNALPIDQLQTASVVLERCPVGFDIYERYEETTVDVSTSSPTPSYKFENVPSALSAIQRYTYRVRAVAINYAATYSTEGGVVPAGNEVDITLTMEPEVFTLGYKIDAGAIGAGFRPTSMQVYVGFSPDGGAPYTVVSQMPNGKEVTWERDGTAAGALDVWKQHTSGKVTRYQIGVGTEEVNGVKQLRPLVDDSLNYTIIHGNPVHYDPVGTQTSNARAATTGASGDLTLTLTPKKYKVLLDLQGGSYPNMPDGYELYEEQGNNVTLWTTQHTWSKPTTIATPTLAGYHLTGWKEVSVDGSSLGTPYQIAGSTLDASVARTIRLEAQWAPGDPPTGGSSGSSGSSGSDSGRKENDGGGKPVQTPEVFARLNTSERIAYIQGYEDGTVRPETPITRGELAMMFYRLLTGDYRRSIFSTSNSYWDITAGIWYNTPVSSFSNAGILKGFSDGSFGGDRPVTRAEFAAIIVRLVGGDNVADGHDFSDITGCWAEQEIALAASLGWILGYEDGTFRPDRSITRAEAVTIINRILGRLEYDPAELGADLKTFTDNTPGLWYYEAIQEAANGTLPDLGEHD